MRREADFTQGKILGPLLRFMVPVFFAMFLQAMYGAVDLLIVGQFAEPADVSAVATGSQIMMTITHLISSFAMGTTIVLGQLIGRGEREEGGSVIGTSITFFAIIAAVCTALIPLLSGQMAEWMNAPDGAVDQTISYLRICGFGSLFIIAYNLIGSIFRGIGDSKTPLITVVIASVCNIGGDLLLIAVFHMGTRGAALATVFAQAISVVLSFFIIRRRKLPFEFSLKDLRLRGRVVRQITVLGLPIALQDFLVSISFLIVTAIVNDLGLIESAGVGVAQKVCSFIMLIPSAFMQAMAAFVAQNFGAGKFGRAKRTLFSAIAVSTGVAVVMFAVSFWRGDLLAMTFSTDAEVVFAAADYLKSYAIDCLLTCFLFCYIGYFNGIGMTRFVMIQGLIGAFFVRVPLSFLFAQIEPVSLFRIGLATPASTVVQIVLCLFCFAYANRKYGGKDRT